MAGIAPIVGLEGSTAYPSNGGFLPSDRGRISVPRLVTLPLNADVAQLVEHWLPKPRVAGSSPVVRSNRKLENQGFHRLRGL